jgi:hypothetical protein
MAGARIAQMTCDSGGLNNIAYSTGVTLEREDETDEDLKQYLENRFTQLEHNIMELVSGRLDAAEERLEEFVQRANHDLETKIITEVHKWGRTSDMRTRQAITDVGLPGERLLAVEDRISALERQRN